MPNFHSFIHQLKTTHHKKHGADRSYMFYPPPYMLFNTQYRFRWIPSQKALRYLSMYDNRYFKGHKDRVVSLCTYISSFMSGSLDHSVRIWDLRASFMVLIVLAAFQGILHLRGRPTVAAYDQQGLVFAVVSMEGGAIKLFDSRSYDKVLI
ncbi:putative transcription factor WD40-like family [Helianthus annuus]|nr:putative transcription factor WD40-like family [Helianthus annuus]KAJ0440830.1 putative transcription factor WD40-like family [Helianthus annuus]KAJ0458928.1 putative transcription factor WD40-like family [Helianthus annuus]KAJ0639468.1 putative transcription factor WD40-like family [Helianthus annuus]KAJ0643455.1 putative transcription factor WD40-like family [Helianthus annuus]